MATIPVSVDVQVNPGVLPAGGDALNLNGLLLTSSTRVPIGQVLSFPTQAAVAAFFGAASLEASYATDYFLGFDNSAVKPGAYLFVQYNVAAVSGWLRGGNAFAALSLTQLQGLSGTLSVTIDGVLKTGSVNLAGATSFTNAAEIIANTLGIEGVQVAAFTGSITATTLTTTAFSSGNGKLTGGCVLSGSGVSANSYIVAQLTSTETDGHLGGLGTYTVSASQTVGSEAITADSPAVQFDSISGAFFIYSGTTGASSTVTYGSGAMATSLLLTQALGAVISPGAVAAVPATLMAAVVLQTLDWATFAIDFNPDNSGNDLRFAFATWCNGQNNRFMFVCQDSDVTPTQSTSAPSSLGGRIAAANLSGTCLLWQPSETFIAAFMQGAVDSIDFNAPNGRVSFKFRRQTGMTPGVTDPTVAANLDANLYNYYAAIGAANSNFQYLRQGQVSGPFDWIDTYVNQISLNNALQLAIVEFLLNVTFIPYNAKGKAMIETALSGTIQQYLNFGAYVAGVQLSGQQIAEVNAVVGFDIASTLSNQGWYLFIGTASPTTRQARGSPPMTFFYVDGESVQQINLASIVLQ